MRVSYERSGNLTSSTTPLGLGNKSTLSQVRKRSRFQFYVREKTVYEILITFNL